MSETAFLRERAAGTVATPLSTADLARFDTVIDARSPAEFAEDRLPGAQNWPVLDDEERARIGTLHKESGAFEAKRVGAPLVARNIARHIEAGASGRPRAWRPLVYCWRGGARSSALVHVLRQVGWNALRLEGGYKAFRRQVVVDLETLPERYRFEVVCGATGSGKSRLLEALAEAGAQVLDLEAIAAHRGSVLGDLPGAPQPSQKRFETEIWSQLGGFDPGRAVFVESESRKVGNLRVPESLMVLMRRSHCLRLETHVPGRIDLLVEDYAHLIADPEMLVAKIECLAGLHGREAIERWKQQVRAKDWRGLVADLLENHYDPAYRRSLFRNYLHAATGTALEVPDASREGFRRLAGSLAATAR